MSEFFTLDVFSAFLQVVLIDLVLAGDNAVVIGLAAAGLPEGQRGKAILIGIGAATALRILFAVAATQILQIVGLSCMLFRWNLPILPGISLPIFEIGLVLTVIAAFLTLISAISYLRAAWPDLRGTE